MERLCQETVIIDDGFIMAQVFFEEEMDLNLKRERKQMFQLEKKHKLMNIPNLCLRFR